MSELELQVGTSDISCFREVKVESRNWRIFVSEIVSSDFDIAALVLDKEDQEDSRCPQLILSQVKIIDNIHKYVFEKIYFQCPPRRGLCSAVLSCVAPPRRSSARPRCPSMTLCAFSPATPRRLGPSTEEDAER